VLRPISLWIGLLHYVKPVRYVGMLRRFVAPPESPSSWRTTYNMYYVNYESTKMWETRSA